MKIEEIIFKKYKQQRIDNDTVLKNINKMLKIANYIYVYGDIESIKEKEWLQNFREYIFLQKHYVSERIVNVTNVEDDIYKIEIKKDNIDIIKNFINEYINNVSEESKIDLHIILAKNDKALVEIDFEHNDYIYSSKINIKNKVLLPVAITVAVLMLLVFYLMFFEYRIVFKVKDYRKIGIIDGAYTTVFDNVNYNTEPKENNGELTHGDYMLEFLNNSSENIEAYYYDASSEEGKINTENILSALEYLKQKEVEVINMSISSKYYSADIESWIKDNSHIKVFASYNNLINSIDYPAMYEEVYGSGKKVDIEFKDKDYTYFTNKVIVFPHLSKVYEGNSYLSLYNSITK